VEGKVLEFPIDEVIKKKNFDTQDEAIAFGQSLHRPFVWGQDKDTKKWKVFPFPAGTQITLTPIEKKEAEVIQLHKPKNPSGNTEDAI